MILLLIKLINKISKHKILYLVVAPYAIGTIFEQLLFVNLSKKNVKKIFLLSPFLFEKKLNFTNFVQSISNSILYKNQKLNNGKIFKILNFILSIEFSIYRFLMLKVFLKKRSDFWENYTEIFISNPKIIFQNFDNKLIENFNIIKSTNFSLEKQIEENCKKEIKNYNIDIDSNFICLHVRDDSFYEDIGRRNFRNSNIDNYIEMINFFKSKGFKIFRMGLKANKKLKNSDNVNIIDYAFADFNSREFDYFLAKNCKFHIRGGGGFNELPNLFNKPCLFTNEYRIYNEVPINPLSRKIFKNIKLIKNNKTLSFVEYLNSSYENHHFSYKYDMINFEENSEEDLFYYGEEYLKTIQNNEKLSPIQSRFNNFIYERYKVMLKNYFLSQKKRNSVNKQDLGAMYIRLSMLKIMQGSFSNNFLRKHFIL